MLLREGDTLDRVRQTSLHYVAEAMTTLYWSRLSDHIGRKPVLLCCLAGTTSSMVVFGFSRSFWTLVFRCYLPVEFQCTISYLFATVVLCMVLLKGP
jgi:MFS family permease